MIGRTEAGKTKNAMDASTQSFRKATTINTTSEVASFKKDASASVIAERTSWTSLLIRVSSVPVGFLRKNDNDRD